MTLNSSISVRDLNLEIKHGEFVCIIGDVGSGKSSFLSSLVGDLLYAKLPFLLKYGESALAEKDTNEAIT